MALAALGLSGCAPKTPAASTGDAAPAFTPGTYEATAQGRNRQVRRMLDAVGHPVIALHREAFGPLVLGDLPRGASRPLAEEEVARLKELAS